MRPGKYQIPGKITQNKGHFPFNFIQGHLFFTNWKLKYGFLYEDDIARQVLRI